MKEKLLVLLVFYCEEIDCNLFEKYLDQKIIFFSQSQSYLSQYCSVS